VSAISTHVLDIAAGCPAAGMRVRLECVTHAGWEFASVGEEMAAASTDAHGRIASLGSHALPPGTYRLIFDTAGYFARQRGSSTSGIDTGAFFPEVTVTFTVAEGEHYHVPLLVTPFGYSTYRGS
jgi:5-hydroxyisourate hydrolase